MIEIGYRKDIGNTVVLEMKPVVGIIGIISLTENISGTFLKSFSYSLDGINYSDQLDLSLITTILFNKKDTVCITIIYTKIDNGEVVDVFLTELVSTIDYDQTYFDTSNFKKFFESSDNELVPWFINVLKKTYSVDNDVLPKFIDRKNKEGLDKDFIDFWLAISKFFSFFVIYSRKYQKFYLQEDLLREFLSQRGMLISQFDSLEELQYLMEKFYHEVFLRGTNNIQSRKVIEDFSFEGFLDYNNTKGEVNGELLRLINFLPKNELLFNLHEPQNFGWNLGNSSPLYRGLGMNKSLYKLTESSKTTKINISLSYEISFKIKTDKPITLRLLGFDSSHDPIKFISQKDGSITDYFFEDLELYRDDIFVYIKCYLYRKDFPINNLNNPLNQGNNLIIGSESVNYIRPVFYIDGLEMVLTEEEEFRINPLETSYSHGILQVYNWISCFIVNNNYSKKLHDVKQTIRKYLIPYNSHLELIGLFPSTIIEIEKDKCDYLIDLSELEIGDDSFQLKVLINGNWVDVTGEVVGDVWIRLQTSDFISEYRVFVSGEIIIEDLVSKSNCTNDCGCIYVECGYWDCSTYP